MRLDNLILALLPISMVVGFGLTRVEWGDPSGFHGRGFPVAEVYWDYPEGAEEAIDYPNPLAAILNMICVFICSAFTLITGWFVLRKLRRSAADT